MFEEQAEDDSEDLKTRLEDIRIEMEYPSLWLQKSEGIIFDFDILEFFTLGYDL